MLIPRFQLSQDAEFLFITAYAPYSNIKDSECHIEGTDFIFFASPYFLKLKLPGKLKDSDRCEGKFNCETQEYIFKIEKDIKGEHFSDLDMISSLLAPRPLQRNPFKTAIEVVNSIDNEQEDDGATSSTSESSCQLSLNPVIPGYGFANKYIAPFDAYEQFLEVFELQKPDVAFGLAKTQQRFSFENGKFSADHYLADLYEDDNIKPFLRFVAPWTELINKKDSIQLTGDELDVLKELYNKEYLLEPEEKNSACIGLIDILYPLMFERRTTLCEFNSESSWTINRLSATLSWFESFQSVEDCVLSSVRRALIYPLYRSFELAILVKSDVVTGLKLGKKYILKCLIEIHNIFNLSQEARYILNQLYIKDYMIFVQKLDDKQLVNLAEELENVSIDKMQLGLDLVEIEHAAKLVHEQHLADISNQAKLVEQINKLNINNTTVGNDNASSTDSESDSDSSSLGSSYTGSTTSNSSDLETASSSKLDSDDDAEAEETVLVNCNAMEKGEIV